MKETNLNSMSPGNDEFATSDTAVSLTEAVLLRALERPPVVHVPDTFAARVVAALPAELPKRRMTVGFGRRIALGSSVVLTLALFALAPHARPSFSNLAFNIELLMLAELGTVAFIATRPGLED